MAEAFSFSPLVLVLVLVESLLCPVLSRPVCPLLSSPQSGRLILGPAADGFEMGH